MKLKTFKVVMIGGAVKKDMYTGLAYNEAMDICEDYGWTIAPDGGFVWDLDIEEE